MRTKYAVETRIKAEDMASPTMRRIAMQARKTAQSFTKLNATAGALRQAGRLARPLERAARTLALGAAGAAAAAVAMTNRYATARDEQAKFARQIGFSADSLDRLKFIAERQGASLDGLRSGLTAFTKRVGELKAGTGSLNGILKKTDPAFAQLLKNTTDNEQAFELFLAKVASLPDEQAKAALAAAGVSRGSMGDIIRLTDGGTAAFMALRAEADKFRAPITPLDLRRAEAYKDAQANLSFAMRGVSDTIASRVIPVLIPFVNRLADWIAANRELIGQKIDSYAQRVGEYLAGIDFDRVAKGAQAFTESARNVAAQVGRVIESLGGIPKIIEIVAKAWLVLKGLSLASLVITLGVQTASIIAAIGGIGTAAKTTSALTAAEFAKMDARAAKSKRLIGGGALGLATGLAAGLNIPGQANIQERQAELEAKGATPAQAFEQAAKEDQKATSDAFDNFLARNLPALFGGLAKTIEQSNERTPAQATPAQSPVAQTPTLTPAKPVTQQVETKVKIEVEAAPGTGAVVREKRTTIFSRPRGTPVGTTMNEGN